MKKWKVIRTLFLVMFVVFTALAINQFYQYKRSEAMYELARRQYQFERDLRNAMAATIEEEGDLNNEPDTDNEHEIPQDQNDENDEIEWSDPSNVEEETNAPPAVVDTPPSENSLSEAGEVIGWISIPGTKIDYPVVQTTDNDFYLTHNYLGNRDVKGAIYMDFRNGEIGEDRNYNIYGHKMMDGTMFSDLTYYVQSGTYQRYFEQYDRVYYDDFETETEWQIFSAYVVNLNRENYYLYTKYWDDDNFQAYIDEIRDRSMVQKEVSVGLDDQIITLVTCNFWYDNARVIVHAVRVN